MSRSKSIIKPIRINMYYKIYIPNTSKLCHHCQKSCKERLCLRIIDDRIYAFIHVDCIKDFGKKLNQLKRKYKKEIEKREAIMVAARI